jgi:hypothetical protein
LRAVDSFRRAWRARNIINLLRLGSDAGNTKINATPISNL